MGGWVGGWVGGGTEKANNRWFYLLLHGRTKLTCERRSWRFSSAASSTAGRARWVERVGGSVHCDQAEAPSCVQTAPNRARQLLHCSYC